MNNTSIRILVVEDDPDIGLMIRLMLECRGYQVTVSQKADKVYSLMLNEKFDLLITDMLLSGMNGTDICTRLKRIILSPLKQ